MPCCLGHATAYLPFLGRLKKKPRVGGVDSPGLGGGGGGGGMGITYLVSHGWLSHPMWGG